MRKEERRFIGKVAFGAILLTALVSGGLVYNHYRNYHYVGRGKLIAKINGVRIHERDVEEFLSLSTKSDGSESDVKLKIDRVDRRLLRAMAIEVYTDNAIYRTAKKHGLTTDDDVKFLTRKYHERLVREKFLNKYIVGNIREDDLKDRYQQLVDMVKDREERKISHIVVATEEEADRIKNMILRFNNFEAMAEKKSLDRESALNGGSIGYVLRENIIIPEFAEIAFLLKIGELSRPIETKNGWHVLRVDDIRNIKIRSYEESRNDILEQMRQEKLEEFIGGFTHRPKVEFFLEPKDKDSADTTTDGGVEKKIISDDGTIQNGDTGGEE
ncbi:MAG: peptidylprolyl isomerase [Rickettsiales bacterium]|nr:peptidylprolyl isomerase [Rickettsiales bacterium]